MIRLNPTLITKSSAEQLVVSLKLTRSNRPGEVVEVENVENKSVIGNQLQHMQVIDLLYCFLSWKYAYTPGQLLHADFDFLKF